MNTIVKVILVILIALYIVSPIDLVPGPIDDVILLLFAVGGNKLTKKNEE